MEPTDQTPRTGVTLTDLLGPNVERAAGKRRISNGMNAATQPGLGFEQYKREPGIVKPERRAKPRQPATDDNHVKVFDSAGAHHRAPLRSMATSDPPRYDDTTPGSARTEAGVPTAIMDPASIATSLSLSVRTNGMSCSMIITVVPR